MEVFQDPLLLEGELPAWSLRDNGAMNEFLKSITLKSIPRNLKTQNDFYIAFKCVLLAAGMTLLVRLILTGRFWLIRVVRTPKGFLICPNACEGLCLTACVFYLIDLFFRGFSIDWLWGNSKSYQHGMPMLYSFRLFFLWLAGFIHLASTLLIWPFDPMRIKPIFWHSFLFGVPIAFLIGFLPNCVRAEVYNRMANDQLVPLLIKLERNPTGSLDASSILIATEGYQSVVKMWKASRDYASVALAFLILLTIGSIVTGYQITFRAAKRYNQIKRAGKQIQTETPIERGELMDSMSSETKLGKESDSSPYLLQSVSSQPSQGAINAIKSTTNSIPSGEMTNQPNIETNSNTNSAEPQLNQSSHQKYNETLRRIEGSKKIEWRKFSHSRLLRYFVGLDPLPQASEADLALARFGKPSQHSIEAVLKDFLYFSIVQFSCLIIIELVMAACAFLIILTIIPDLHNQTYVPRYTTTFARTAYIFFVLEIWVIISIGSPLILIMLWRQLYPIRVDFGNDIYTRQPPILKMKNVKHLKTFRLKKKAKQTEDQDDQNSNEILAQNSIEWQNAPWTPSTRATAASTKASQDPDPSAGANNITIIRKTPSLDGFTTEEEYDRDHLWSSNYTNDAGEDVCSKKESESITRDLCGLAGSDLGVRRIVLDALDSANKYPTRKLGSTTTSVWQRAEAAHLQERRISAPSHPSSESPLQRGKGQQQLTNARRNSNASFSASPNKRNSPPMLSRFQGSLRRNQNNSVQKDSSGIPMSNFTASLQPPENARFVTPHGFVQSRPYE